MRRMLARCGQIVSNRENCVEVDVGTQRIESLSDAVMRDMTLDAEDVEHNYHKQTETTLDAFEKLVSSFFLLRAHHHAKKINLSMHDKLIRKQATKLIIFIAQ